MNTHPKILLALALTAVLACPGEKNCLGCKKGTDQCLVCEDGFLNLDRNRCDTSIATPIDFCKTYYKGSPSICKRCDFGHDVGTNDKGDSICVPCSKENCAQCLGNVNKCTACFAPAMLAKEGDDFVCKVQKVRKFPNCRISKNAAEDTAEKCLLCIGNHMINKKGACVPDKFGKCWFGDTNDAGCLVCRHGHFLTKEGTCLENRYAPEDVDRRRKLMMMGAFGLVVLAFVIAYFLCFKRRAVRTPLRQPIFAN
jgi:hypothetical protein